MAASAHGSSWDVRPGSQWEGACCAAAGSCRQAPWRALQASPAGSGRPMSLQRGPQGRTSCCKCLAGLAVAGLCLLRKMHTRTANPGRGEGPGTPAQLPGSCLTLLVCDSSSQARGRSDSQKGRSLRCTQAGWS